uniref:Uncharacterized LOC111230066 n=1 Tax=Seriola dumerili TaxID=41447 RepID=A0A3B4UMA0_SERDU
MESAFLTFILLSLFAVYSSHIGVTEWNDVVVAREGMPTTLVCTDSTVRNAVTINWKVKSHGAHEWKLVLSANARMNLSGNASKESMRLKDSNFQDSGVFSLVLSPKMEDSGLYICIIQQEKIQKQRIILLATLKVVIIPAPTIPKHSTLQLIARVNPDFAVTKITWVSPNGIFMKSETVPKTGTVAKLPRVTNSAAYICMVHPLGNSSGSSSISAFSVNVNVDAVIHTATQAQTSFNLTCPGVRGDYVRLHWQPPDAKKKNMKIVYKYDRWRSSTILTDQSKRLTLAGPPYNAEAGNFSFLLIPGIKDGGLYVCEVFLNDNAFSQKTLLSVMKVKTKRSPSKLELGCQYSEQSHIQSAKWKHQNKSRQLHMTSNGPGTITTSVPLPITPDTAGNYTCTLKLKTGQTIWATQAVTLPPKEIVGVPTPPMLPSLSALLLLVPLVAAAVGVLLWRQKHISDRGIEQSLSVHSGETENIYENPEDIRQVMNSDIFYDLKPRGEDDVYTELEQ